MRLHAAIRRRAWMRSGSGASQSFSAGRDTVSPFFPAQAPLQRTAEAAGTDEERRIETRPLAGPQADEHEREADRIADRVASGAAAGPATAGPGIARMPAAPGNPAGGRGLAMPAAAQAVEAVSRGGSPLSREECSFFEPRLGADFSAVRVHADERARMAAAAIRARAYTVGSHIAFASGQYAPGSPSARRLMAHELVHTIQQGRAGFPTLQRETMPQAAEPEIASPAQLPPEDRYHVIVVGSPGPAEVSSGRTDQFLRAAEAHPFAQLGSSLRVVWLVERTGYEFAGMSLSAVRARGPRHLFFIDEATSLTSLLNAFPPGSIRRLDAYSHGVPGAMTLRYGWSGRPNYGLTTAQARALSPRAFASDALLSFDSCNSGTRDDGRSLAHEVAQSTQRITEGWTGRTSYRIVNAERWGEDRRVVASEIMPPGGRFDPTEFGSQLRGRYPRRVTFRPWSAPGSFESWFQITVRLPESRHFPVPAGARVRVTIAPDSEFVGVRGRNCYVILWRSISWARDDDNGGSRRVEIGRESSIEWSSLREGTYYVEIYHLHGVEVSGPIQVEVLTR